MAVSFLANREILDLCLGKPPLNWRVHVDSKISEALLTLKRSGETHVSVWSCGSHTHSSAGKYSCCECVGKICMVDFISFLCKEENLANPLKAFEEPISQILVKGPPFTVRHIEPNSSVLEAIDCILNGVQNLIIPIDKIASKNVRKKLLKKSSSLSSFSLHNGVEYCWLTQEDVARYLLNFIALFSPFSTLVIESLKIIDHDFMTINYEDPASTALSSISRAHTKQTSVAVINENKRLIGEISPFTLACCDETVAAAITTLCAGDLMAYIDSSGPPEHLVQLVKARLEEKNLEAMVDLLVEEYSMYSSASSCCSTDDDSTSSKSGGGGGGGGGVLVLARHFPGRRSEPIVCYPWSSVVAAMIQMLSHRATYIWVVEEDHTLVGLLTFEGILEVFCTISDTHKVESNNSSSQ